jgi:hypothetical protein
MALSLQAVSQSPKSITAWLGAAVVLLTFMGGQPDALVPYVSVESMQVFLRIAGYLVGAGVIVNRFFTDGTLESKAPGAA